MRLYGTSGVLVVNIVTDASIDMLLLYVMIINVMFLNVKKDTRKLEGLIEITKGISLQ